MTDFIKRPFLLCILLSGCASVTVVPVKPEDTTTAGIRIYRPEPYLLITTGQSAKASNGGATTKPADGGISTNVVVNTSVVTAPNPSSPPAPAPEPKKEDQSYTVQVIWLPNYNYGYAIQTQSGLGTVEGAIKLQNGWQLTDLNAKADTKIPETITAFTGLVTAAAKAATLFAAQPSEQKGNQGVIPGLYRMVYDPKTGYFEYVVPVYLFTKTDDVK